MTRSAAMLDAALTVRRTDIDATIQYWRDHSVPPDWIAVYLWREGLRVRGRLWDHVRPAMKAYARMRRNAPVRVAA